MFKFIFYLKLCSCSVLVYCTTNWSTQKSNGLPENFFYSSSVTSSRWERGKC